MPQKAMELFPLLVLATALACAPPRLSVGLRPDLKAAMAAYVVLIGEALDADLASRVGAAALLRDM